MEIILSKINGIIWGIPVLTLIVVTGLYLTRRSHFCQIKLFPLAVLQFIRSLRRNAANKDNGNISGYRALCTALAATVGTGNIAGVAGAIAIGGPGVIFWMWICAILGMITKFAEVTIALRYRTRNTMGELVGGPMYMIQLGLPGKYKPLSYIYAFLGVVAAFGVGNATQVNAVIDGFKSAAKAMNYQFGLMDSCVLGVIIIVLLVLAFHHGANGVGCWAENLVPAASVCYIFLAVGFLFLRRNHIMDAFVSIIKGALYPQSVTCGIISSSFLALRVGASRGVFTNEAGMGTASIAHAGADTTHPVEQGMLGMIEVFIDTILICTLTALVILCSGIPIPYGSDPGIALTLDAFSAVYGTWCRIAITGLVCILAFATILGWGLYGARCAQFLFGDGVWRIYVYMQSFAVLLGILLKTSVIWLFAEIVNGFMAIPNLIALYLLSPEFFRLLNEYNQMNKAYSPK